MHAFRYIPVFLLLIFAASNSFAAAKDDFDEGVEYFKQKQYQQAVKAFTRSYTKGLKTPALFHNLGVSYFKLENYAQAKKHFELAQAYPRQKMLAEYNLGLVAKKQNKPALAKKHFTLVKQQAKDNKLVTLARIQLGEIKTLKPEHDWFVYAKLGYGYDDNITAIPETTATQKSSNFTDIYVGGEIQLTGHSKSGIALTGFGSGFDYIDYDRYDYSQFSLGIEGTFPTGSWANALELSSQKFSYGHADYQKITRFQAKTKTYITRNNSLRFRYQHDDISSKNPTYDYLAGTRQRLRAELRNYGEDHYAKFYYQYELNDRANTTTANFSPTRNTLHAYYEHALTNFLKLGAGISYRISIYPAKTYANPNPPPDFLTTAEREDTRQIIALRLTYKLNKTWKVRGQIEQTDNESTNPAYIYQRELTSLSLIASF